MTEKQLVIRLMTEEDLDEISILYTDIYDKVAIGEHWTKESSYSLFKYWLSRQKDLCFIALLNHKIIGGFVAGVKPWRDGNHLVDGEVFVDYKYHKHKIGTFLSKTIYEAALDKYNITSIDLVTFSKD